LYAAALSPSTFSPSSGGSFQTTPSPTGYGGTPSPVAFSPMTPGVPYTPQTPGAGTILQTCSCSIAVVKDVLLTLTGTFLE